MIYPLYNVCTENSIYHGYTSEKIVYHSIFIWTVILIINIFDFYTFEK